MPPQGRGRTRAGRARGSQHRVHTVAPDPPPDSAPDPPANADGSSPAPAVQPPLEADSGQQARGGGLTNPHWSAVEIAVRNTYGMHAYLSHLSPMLTCDVCKRFTLLLTGCYKGMGWGLRTLGRVPRTVPHQCCE